MAQTVGETLRKARANLGERTPTRWEDWELRQWLNDAQREIARRMRWYNKQDDLTALAGTQEYNLFADCFMVTDAWYTPTGGQRYPMDYIDRRNIRRDAFTSYDTVQSTPNYWSLRGHPGTASFKFMSFPIPAQGGTFTVDYYGVPADWDVMVPDDDTNSILVPEGFESLVVDFVTSQAFLSDQKPQWESYGTKYETSMAELEDVVYGTDQQREIREGPYSYAADDEAWV